VLIKNGIAISMDGKGAWRDNVFVERLWRSVKYEEVYLRAYDTASEARASIGRATGPFGLRQSFANAQCVLRWPRLSEQIFRVDKWSVCRG
jgi:transposase InsO family protein